MTMTPKKPTTDSKKQIRREEMKANIVGAAEEALEEPAKRPRGWPKGKPRTSRKNPAEGLGEALGPAHEAIFNLTAMLLKRDVPKDHAKQIGSSLGDLGARAIVAHHEGELDEANPRLALYLYLGVAAATFGSIFVYPRRTPEPASTPAPIDGEPQQHGPSFAPDH